MKLRLRPFSVLALSLTGLALSVTPACSQNEKTDFGVVAAAVAHMMGENHYSQEDFDDSLSRKALRNYLDYLDYSRLYFIRPEVDAFRAKYDSELDDLVLLNNLAPANEIYALYMKKLEARIGKAKAILEGPALDFTAAETAEISRKEVPWANTEEELDKVWVKQLKREVLQERLNARRADERRKETEAKAKAEGAKPDPQSPPTTKNDKIPDTPEFIDG